MIFFKRKNIARFEKVSYEEFEKRFMKLYLSETEDAEIKPDIVESDGSFYADALYNHYDQIKTPTRSTPGSAGYDFMIPFDFALKKGEVITIPTGIKVYIKNGWTLKMYPRSSYGNMGIKIETTVPIIDEDYYNNSKTEGEIMLKITNENKFGRTLNFHAGDKFVQGTFDIYGLAEEEPPKKKRDGGFGSTGSIFGSQIYK